MSLSIWSDRTISPVMIFIVHACRLRNGVSHSWFIHMLFLRNWRNSDNTILNSIACCLYIQQWDVLSTTTHNTFIAKKLKTRTKKVKHLCGYQAHTCTHIQSETIHIRILYDERAEKIHVYFFYRRVLFSEWVIKKKEKALR